MGRNNLILLKLKIRILKNHFMWFLYGIKSKISRKKIIDENLILSASHLKNILIFAPHADDEWIGCSQAIKLAEKTTVYYFNFLGNNCQTENEIIRLNEIKKVSEELNFKLITSTIRDEDYSDLKDMITKENYSAVFIPFPLDWHTEHIKVNDIVIDIFSKLNILSPIYFYHISVPIPDIINEYSYLPLSKDDIEHKINVFDQHYISQRNTPIRRLALQNKIWAQGQKFYAAEVYAQFKIDTWNYFLNFVHGNFTEIKKIIHLIDHPTRIRKSSNKIFLRFMNTSIPKKCS